MTGFDVDCPLPVKGCATCMYACDRCIHPSVSGMTDQQMVQFKAESLGLEGQQLEQHIQQQNARIQHALLLDSYAEHITTNDLRVRGGDFQKVLTQALDKSLLQLLLPHLNLDTGHLLAMCVRRTWAQWAEQSGCDLSFEEVSGVNQAALLLLRSKLPVV